MDRTELEEAKPFKPLSKRSKFAKANQHGQIAANCIEFDFWGKNGNCQNYNDWQEVNHPCKVCIGEYCKDYRASKTV